ncbi:hypothetical protein FE782_30820 [Paenibacillus antri]|uniref:Uncharacterized protein n=1 Tax=Paenibacillus antri TaxID=2582848 RepID=A0A5R9G6M2_9BACL|nr:DUF5957 family protein [Paenibacillus antri]TLS48403.1 hypothetical protein FE782_30820 [Paenibacillus antri]
MKTVFGIIFAYIGGYFGGALVAKGIAVAGLWLFEEPTWLMPLRYLPFLSGIGCAIALLWLTRRRKP